MSNHKCPLRGCESSLGGLLHAMFCHNERATLLRPLGAAPYARTMQTSDGLVYWIDAAQGWTSIKPVG